MEKGWIVNEYTQRKDRLINRLMDKILTSDSSASFLSFSVYEILAEVEGFCGKATDTVIATFSYAKDNTSCKIQIVNSL